jgi:hypothetical protein
LKGLNVGCCWDELSWVWFRTGGMARECGRWLQQSSEESQMMSSICDCVLWALLTQSLLLLSWSAGGNPLCKRD